MTVANTGQPCGVTLYGLPAERQNPVTRGVVTGEPRHGKAEFVGPRIQYTPAAGYVGEDEFACESWSVGPANRSLRLTVRMKVIVRAP